MARPKKIGLEYFPVDVQFDEKIDAIEMVHGNDGLTWVIKFWQSAYRTETGEVDLSGVFTALFAAKCRISQDKNEAILHTAKSVGFCYEVDNGRYTSEGIKKRIGAVSKEREDAIVRQEQRLALKAEKGKFVAPSREDVREYFAEREYPEALADRFFDGYSESNWIDSQCKKINNWKQKAIHVWFRDDNKIESQPIFKGKKGFDKEKYRKEQEKWLKDE